MSSSDDSSEDEEEKNRIIAAVSGVGPTLYGNKSSFSAKENSCETSSQKSSCNGVNGIGRMVNGIDVSKLKSNRPKDKNDDDEHLVLQTTPEFRTYVAKQLSKLLDSKLSECIAYQAWERHLKKTGKAKGGVRLFSNSKLLCDINFGKSSKKDPAKTAHEAKKRKIKLSSSSESSEDEDIKACVFSVADIEEENKRLARLEENKQKSEREKGVEKMDGGGCSISPQKDKTILTTVSSDVLKEEGAKIKKKKKKKKHKRLKAND